MHALKGVKVKVYFWSIICMCVDIKYVLGCCIIMSYLQAELPV